MEGGVACDTWTPRSQGAPALGHDLTMFFFLYVQRKLLSLKGRDVGPVGSSLRTVTRFLDEALVVDSIRLHFIMESFDVLSHYCRVARDLSRYILLQAVDTKSKEEGFEQCLSRAGW